MRWRDRVRRWFRRPVEGDAIHLSLYEIDGRWMGCQSEYRDGRWQVVQYWSDTPVGPWEEVTR